MGASRLGGELVPELGPLNLHAVAIPMPGAKAAQGRVFEPWTAKAATLVGASRNHTDQQIFLGRPHRRPPVECWLSVSGGADHRQSGSETPGYMG